MNHSIAPIERLHRAFYPERPGIDLFELGYLSPFVTDLPAPETEAALPDAAEDASEAPPLIAPPKRDVQQETWKLFAPIFEELSKLNELSQEEKTRCSSFKSELSGLSQRVGEFLAQMRESKIGRLTAEHVRAAAECRTQKGLVEAAEQRVNDSQNEIRKANAALSLARAKFNAAHEQQPRADSWPTAAEVNRWRKQCELAQAALTAADESQSRVFESDRNSRQELSAARAELTRLAQVESVLRNRLSGREWTDPEFGLVSPPEL